MFNNTIHSCDYQCFIIQYVCLCVYVCERARARALVYVCVSVWAYAYNIGYLCFMMIL